jgi:hypothetical protein
MAPRNSKSDKIESLLHDPQNLPEIMWELGQFESEEAYEQFRAEWEASKPRRSSVPEIPRRRV